VAITRFTDLSVRVSSTGTSHSVFTQDRELKEKHEGEKDPSETLANCPTEGERQRIQ